jgi:hypothetical protein
MLEPTPAAFWLDTPATSAVQPNHLRATRRRHDARQIFRIGEKCEHAF